MIIFGIDLLISNTIIFRLVTALIIQGIRLVKGGNTIYLGAIISVVEMIYPAGGMTYPAEGMIHPAERMTHPAEGMTHSAEEMTYPAEGMIHPAEGMTHPAEEMMI